MSLKTFFKRKYSIKGFFKVFDVRVMALIFLIWGLLNALNSNKINNDLEFYKGVVCIIGALYLLYFADKLNMIIKILWNKYLID